MTYREKNPWISLMVGLVIVIISSWLMVTLKDVLTPFVVAGVLAYVFNPLVQKLQAHGFGRSVSALLVMFASVLIVVAALVILIPIVVNQIDSLSSQLPVAVDWVQNTIIPKINQWIGIQIELNSSSVRQWLQDNIGSFQGLFSKAVPTLVRKSGSALALMSNILLIPFLLYYFLADWSSWTRGIQVLMPKRILPIYLRISGSIDQVLSEFLRGQLMVMMIMGLVYGIGLMLVGLHSGFAIGMVAGILVFVPYLGAFTGLLLATIAAFLQFDSWINIFLVWSVFGVGQFLESFFITPKIVGDRIGLSPFWVIFALMAFGQLLGFVGMLLALPLAAVTLVLLREAAHAYLGSRYYQQEPRYPVASELDVDDSIAKAFESIDEEVAKQCQQEHDE